MEPREPSRLDDPAVQRGATRALAADLEVRAAIDDVVRLLLHRGIAARDLTYETVSALLTKPLPGYGELFRMLSYQEIGPAAMLSRALGGLMEKVVLLVMPGSRAAVELAMTRLILPELPHLAREARKH